MNASRPGRRARAEAERESEGTVHLVFKVGGEECALPMLAVQRIVALGGTVPLPEAPPALHGVLDLPGESPLAVVDLDVAFGGRGRENTSESCVLVVAGTSADAGASLGLAVDEVSRVIAVAPEQLAAAPRLGTLFDASLLAAMARIGSHFIPVLDLERLQASPEVRAAVSAAKAGREEAAR